MGKKHKTANYSNKYQITRLLLTNLATASISVGICICLSSMLCYKMDLDETVMYYFTFPIIALCSFLNGYVMATMIRVKGWMVGLGANLIFLLVMVASHFIVGGSPNEGMFLLKAGLIIVCGTLGGITGVNKKKKIR